MVQTEVGARRSLRLAMVNSAFGDTPATVTLGTSGSHPRKFMELLQMSGRDMGSAGGKPSGNCNNLSKILTDFSRVGARLRRTA